MRFRQLASLLVLVSALAHGESLAVEPPPVADFVRAAEFDTARLSPDGRYLAVTINNNGIASLLVLEAGSDRATANIRFDLFEGIAWFTWVNEERLLIRLQATFGQLDRPLPTGELWAVNADGSGYKQVFGFHTKYRARRGTAANTRSYAQLCSRLSEDRRHVIVAAHPVEGGVPVVYRVNVYSGKRQELARGPVESSFGEALTSAIVCDSEGIARVATGLTRDGKEQLHYRSAPNTPWVLLADLPLAPDSTVEPIAIAPDGKRFFAYAAAQSATRGLYLVDPDQQQMELIYSHPIADIDHVVWAPDRSEIVAVGMTPDIAQIVFLDSTHRTARLHEALAEAFPGESVNLVNWTKDESRVLLYVYSDRNPGAYYLFDTSSNDAQFLFSRRPWLDSDSMAVRQPVTMSARDGLVLRGYLTLPPAGNENLPLIVLPHGGPHGVRDWWAFDTEAQLFASRGYAVLQINFRGSDGYGPAFRAAGYKKWGTSIQDDLTDATRWAVREGIADPQRICIFGASFGGYSAVMSVIREPDLYRCAVGYAGVYALDRLDSSGDIAGTSAFVSRLAQMVGDDDRNLKSMSPADNAQKINVPVFIVHGKEDQRAPVAHANALRAALEAEDKPYEWMVKAGEGHGFYNLDNRIELYERMLEFFAKHTAVAAD